MANPKTAKSKDRSTRNLLATIQEPADLKKLSVGQLPALAQEIRHAICEQVSKTGGHLAPNLGVVELTIALHYVFDFAQDRLLFDVGHQCYPHKLLTGRQGLLPKLRQRDGMAGFPEPRESPFDLFSVGHAGTSISTAVGLARADQINGEEHRRSVALIGDASIVNGVAMEGLNNAGTLKRQFLVVLNDNGMSIAKPQGALAGYFDKFRINPHYDDFKKRALEVINRLPGGWTLKEAYHRLGEMTKAALAHDHLYDHFGLMCVGPIDGHALPSLVEMLHEIKDIGHPVLLHCKTIKGKGYDFATGDPTTFHSPKPFVVEGCRVELKKSGRSFTAAFADTLIEVMGRDEKVFAVTAAMPDGTGLNQVMTQFPQRTLDTGICESHAMDMCAGMAKAGIKPFFAVYSTFVQRALDQVFQEVALQGLPVRVCLDRAGYVGGDGAVHHGFMDIALFAPLPGTVMLAASDEPNLRAAMEFMRAYDDGCSVIRYPRDDVALAPLQSKPPPFQLGRANLVRPARPGGQPAAAVLAYGTMVYQAAAAIEQLGTRSDNVALYDARFAKPVDAQLIKKLIEAGTPILTVEDHARAGGFGAIVLEACNEMRLPTELIYRLAMPDRWMYQSGRTDQLAEAGIDANGIAQVLGQILDTHAKPPLKIHVDAGRAKVVR